MTGARINHFLLRDALSRLLSRTPDLSWVADRLPTLDYVPETAVDLPITRQLSDLDTFASDETREAIAAIQNAAPYLRWQRSYSVEQVGRDHYNRYGWFNLISPEGLFLAADMRLSIGVWREGLVYPRHWHRPEETYLILAGEAELTTDGHPPRWVRPGDRVHHPPNTPHGMVTDLAPLVAAAVWTGEGLLARSTMPESVS